MTFQLLEIKEEIIKALKEDGIVEPTKIQKIAIPHIKSGEDVIGISNTGSGKTAAFGIPLLEKINSGGGVQVLILVPTRELAVQIKDELKRFSKYLKCNIAAVFGGVALGPQANRISKSEIVIGTTGRTLDHMRRGNLDLRDIKCVVLDEADKMVEMGFIEDIETILNETPEVDQILLFGATISHEVDSLKQTYMQNPKVAKAELNVKEDILEQYYYDVQSKEKFSLLVHLLKQEDTERTMIFCSTRANVEVLTKNLKAQGLSVEMIHGKLNQNRRLKIIEDFNNGNPKILIASAVAARGLHIDNVSHVFNYSLSKDPQEYVHRVGRTARAGESGKAITLLEQRDYEVFGQILDRHNMHVEKLEKPSFERLVFHAKSKHHARGRYSGNRSGGRSGGQSSRGGRSSHSGGSSGRSYGNRSGGSGGRSGGHSGGRSGGGSGGRSSGRSYSNRSGGRSGGHSGGGRSYGNRSGSSSGSSSGGGSGGYSGGRSGGSSSGRSYGGQSGNRSGGRSGGHSGGKSSGRNYGGNRSGGRSGGKSGGRSGGYSGNRSGGRSGGYSGGGNRSGGRSR